jgi:hypothetical protein
VSLLVLRLDSRRAEFSSEIDYRKGEADEEYKRQPEARPEGANAREIQGSEIDVWDAEESPNEP